VEYIARSWDVFSIADALGIDTDDVEETTDVLYALLTENYIDQEEYPIEVSTIIESYS